MSANGHLLVTGGAGYIGSLLTSELLCAGYRVTIMDSLLYGGESLLGFLAHPPNNLGSNDGNFTKDEIVGLVIKHLPDTMVTYKDLIFGGDMRDITVSFSKIRRELGFNPALTVDDGVREIVKVLRDGLIRNPQDEKYTNARFIIQ